MPARKSRQVETRMVSEYIAARYSAYTSLTKVPLGIVPAALSAEVGIKKAAGLIRPFRPEADAVVILPNYLLLIEAKVWQVVTGLGKMPLYKSLVPLTPELRQYMPREVLMELVVGETNPNLEVMAQAVGVKIQIFNPPWLQAVVDDMHKYWTADYRNARQQKQELREYFGIE